MKSTLFISFILIGFVSNVFSQPDQNTKINAFLDEWHQDAADVNMKSYFNKIAEDGIYIGTDATEVWTKQEFYDWAKPYFEKGRTWNFKASERNIYLADNESIAWFDERLQASYGELRGSGVLMKEDGEWKIKHYVLSLPVPNEKFWDVNKIIEHQE